MNYYKAHFLLSVIVVMGIVFIFAYRVAFSPSPISLDSDEDTLDLKAYQWKNRVILIFEDKKPSQVFKEQQESFLKYNQALLERDIKIFIFSDKEIPLEMSESFSAMTGEAYRKHFRIAENKFQILLIGKDGGVKLQKDKFTPPTEIFTSIDGMPMRRQEIRKNE
jgi:hypothetical protein